MGTSDIRQDLLLAITRLILALRRVKCYFGQCNCREFGR